MLKKFNKIVYHIHYFSPKFTQKDSNSIYLILKQIKADIDTKPFNRDTLLMHTKKLKQKTQTMCSIYENRTYSYAESIKTVRAQMLQNLLYKTYSNIEFTQQLLVTIPHHEETLKALIVCKKEGTIANITALMKAIDAMEEKLK